VASLRMILLSQETPERHSGKEAKRETQGWKSTSLHHPCLPAAKRHGFSPLKTAPKRVILRLQPFPIVCLQIYAVNCGNYVFLLLGTRAIIGAEGAKDAGMVCHSKGMNGRSVESAFGEMRKRL